MQYVDQIHQYYQVFYDKQIPVDLISVDSYFSQYDLIVAPVLYLVKEDLGKRLEAFVGAGGQFLTTFMSGIVNQSDNVHLGGYPGPLRKLLGIWVEEIDALAPEQVNRSLFVDGMIAQCQMLCDSIQLEGAQAVATYESDFYADSSVATNHHFGNGESWYVGSQLEQAGLAHLVTKVVEASGIEPLFKDGGALEMTTREKEGHLYPLF